MGIPVPTVLPASFSPLCRHCQTAVLSPEECGKELSINCLRCDKPYCEKHVSKIDPRFCQECLKDVIIIQTNQLYNGVEEMLVIDPHGERPDTVVKIPYKTRYKQITLKGTDWLFAEIWIQSLSDTQLTVALQWHKAILTEIETAITEHKIKKARELALQPVPKVVAIKKEDPDKVKAKLAKLLGTFAKTFGEEQLKKAMEMLQNGAK